MIRLTLTALLAAMLAVTSHSPAHAQLSQSDINRLLAGAVTLGVVAVAIDRAKDRGKKDKKVSKRRNDNHRGGNQYRQRLIPAQCVIGVPGRRGGLRHVVGKRCLERSVRRADRLPARCGRQVSAFGRDRDVFALGCLTEFEWTVAQHR